MTSQQLTHDLALSLGHSGVSERLDDVAQRAERLVDGGAFLQPVARRTCRLSALAATPRVRMRQQSATCAHVSTIHHQYTRKFIKHFFSTQLYLPAKSTRLITDDLVILFPASLFDFCLKLIATIV